VHIVCSAWLMQWDHTACLFFASLLISLLSISARFNINRKYGTRIFYTDFVLLALANRRGISSLFITP